MTSYPITPLPTWSEPSTADKALTAAFSNGYIDLAGVIAALTQGADPNRPILDPWRKGEGRLPYYQLCDDIRLRRGIDLAATRLLHARAMAAMAKAGADFSLPMFYGTNAHASDRASQMWKCPGIGPESIAIYAKHGGRMDTFFSEKSFCGLFSREARIDDAEMVLALWRDCGLRERVESLGMRTTLLTRMIGSGYEDGARALAALGARPAPLTEASMVSDQETGYTSLHLLAVDAAYYCRPAGTAILDGTRREGMDIGRILRLAELAVALGEDPNALAANGRSALHCALRKKGHKNFPAMMALCEKFAELGARAIPSANGEPLCVQCGFDVENAVEKLAFALRLGDDLSTSGQAAARALLSSSGPGGDKLAAQALAFLVNNQANLAEDVDHPVQADQSLAGLAALGMPACLEELSKQGPIAQWVCPKTGATIASLACLGETSSSAPHQQSLALAIALGAPLEQPYNGMTPLHLAAASLDHIKCAMLLTAGADPNSLSKDGWTALHYATAEHGVASFKPQMGVFAAFAAAPATEWIARTPQGATPFSLLAKKGSSEALLFVAKRDPDCLGAHPAGQAASKALSRRSGAILASIEKIALGSLIQLVPIAKARSRM